VIPLRRRTSRDDRLRAGRLRVAIVAEAFLPAVNGVTNSVRRVAEHLRALGHDVVIIAPGPGSATYETAAGDVPVVRMPAFDLPGYDDLRIGLPAPRMTALLRDFDPDVVHLAAPTVLGASGVAAAVKLGIPTVAVYQTDLAGFARRHHLGRANGAIWSYLRWVHDRASLTLAPSTASAWALRARGVERVELWARGVDLDRFHPRHRSTDLHRLICPNGEVLVGYVGRLAKEKQVERLAPICELPGVHVIVVGDGPERAALASALPTARFVGFQDGRDLSRLYATLDVFVHTGIDETFCQALQEAMASGVANVAPSAGGPLDLVRHRETGFFWSPEVPETLVGAVAQLAADPELRARLGSAARRDVESRPWSTVLDALVGHYWRLVRGRRPHAAGGERHGGMTGPAMHIVQLANFYGPSSGGLRVAVDSLAAEYERLGHRRTLIVPGERDERIELGNTVVWRVKSPLVPGLGGYRAIVRRGAVDELVAADPPDVIELSDKSTLVACARRARRRGVPVVLFSHERLDAVVRAAVIDTKLSQPVLDRYNRRLLRSIDAIVCASRFAAAEYERAAPVPLHIVPLGVDLERFRPAPLPVEPDRRPVIVSAVRLTADKQPDILVATSRELRRRGVEHALRVFGDGPLRPALERSAAGLPIEFAGFVPDRRQLAAAMAYADVGISPGPAETFGLAALEVMACGTPVVVPGMGALPEVVGDGGVVAERTPDAFADAIESILTDDPAARRGRARAHAATFTWASTAEAMLAVHRSVCSAEPARPVGGASARQAERSNL
jgi:phosphatidylinositol alpha 1,6-mannosyltransferase